MYLWAGHPWKREVNGLCVAHQFRWLTQCQQHRLGFGHTIGNLVSVNRNSLIAQAKEFQKATEDPMDVVHFQMDSDAYPVTSLDDCARFAREDFDAGYGLVLAPVHGISAQNDGPDRVPVKEWQDAPGAKPSPDKPWTVLGGSFTMVWFNPLLLQKLTPVHSFTPVGKAPIPIYCASVGENTEDIHLCNRSWQEYDMPVCADPRLRVRHMKELFLDGYGLLPDEV